VSSRILVALILLTPAGAAAQRIEARIGVLAATTLVRDEGASGALQRALNLGTSAPTELTLSPAPSGAVLVVQPIGPRTAIEAQGMVALSKLQAKNRENDWQAQQVSIAVLTVGLRYRYRGGVWLHGGVGVNRFFTESRGIFSDGSSVMPLIEVGAMTRIPAGALPIHLAARVQTHTFGTPVLRREGANDGKPIRFLVQLGFGR
jgi:hypothetical protein